MSSENETGNKPVDNQKPGGIVDDAGETTGKSVENTNSHSKEKPHVLHEDGSFADLPDGDSEGSGALDGTVGLGT